SRRGSNRRRTPPWKGTASRLCSWTRLSCHCTSGCDRKPTAPPNGKFRSAAAARLTLSKLDVSVDGREAHTALTRLADVRAKMLGIESAAERHLEVRVERPIHGREVYVAVEFARKLDAHAAVHGAEVHPVGGIHVTHSNANAPIRGLGVDRSTGRRHLHL